MPAPKLYHITLTPDNYEQFAQVDSDYNGVKIQNDFSTFADFELQSAKSALSTLPKNVTIVDFSNTHLDQLDKLPELLSAVPEHVITLILNDNNLADYCKDTARTTALLNQLGRFKNVMIAGNNLGNISPEVEFKWPENKKTIAINLDNNNLAALGDRLIAFLKSIGSIQTLWLSRNNFNTLERTKTLAAAIEETAFSENSRLNLGSNFFAKEGIDCFKALFTRFHENIESLELYMVGLCKLNFKDLKTFFSILPKNLKSVSIHANEINSQKLTSQTDQTSALDGFQQAIAPIPHGIKSVNLSNNKLLVSDTHAELNFYAKGLPPTINQIICDSWQTKLTYNRPHLQDLKNRYIAVATDYALYTKQNCFWSIKAWHGETGRITAEKIKGYINNAKSIEELEKIVMDTLNGAYGGRTNPHSLRTLFLAEKLGVEIFTRDNLVEVSDKFAEHMNDMRAADFQIM